MGRRHLSREQKRALIADQLRESHAAGESPSDRRIAEILGVSHHTVKAVRDELEGIGQVAQCTTRLTKDGRQYPARRPRTTYKGDAETDGAGLWRGAE